MGKRRPPILIGYGLGALAKPLFALARTASAVMRARFAERIGKGLRGTPGNALVAAVTPPEICRRAFGLRQLIDTVAHSSGHYWLSRRTFPFEEGVEETDRGLRPGRRLPPPRINESRQKKIAPD